MIQSEYTIVDLGAELNSKNLPVYTDNANLKIYSLPNWLDIGYSEGMSVTITDGKLNLTLTPREGVFEAVYNDTLVLSNVGDTEFLEVSVIWTFSPNHVSLNNIADILEIDFEGTSLEGMNRIKILKKLKEGLREVGFQGEKKIERFETTRDETSTINCPVDMISPIAIYAVDDYGNLGIMYEDKTLNKGSYSPLRDEDGEIILDNNAYWLEVSGITNSPDKETPYYNDYPISACGVGDIWTDADYNRNGSRFTNIAGIQGGKKSFYGQYIYDNTTKTFFIQNCPFDQFVIEYVSDSMINANLKRNYAQIRVHEYYRESLIAWTYHELIKYRSDVPQSEKERARRENALKRKQAAKKSINASALIQAIKTRRNINKR